MSHVQILVEHDLFRKTGFHFSGSCSRENRMKEATKRAASEALAQIMAVTAMLVIAGFVFYWR